ncbi:MAG: permease-like cell division protein FtsX [bacterium]
MIKWAYILKELMRNLGRHPMASLASFLSLTLLFLLLDLFWIAAGTSHQFYDQLISDVHMECFVAESVSDTSLAEVQDSLEAIEGVLSTRLVSRQDARYELARLVGTDLLVGYDSINPLPRSFVVTPDPGFLTGSRLDQIEQQANASPSIEQVDYPRDWLAKAETARELVRSIGLGLGGLILLTALISSFNGIRLTIRVRAVGLNQMRTLGASKSFLAMPFLLESLIIAALAAAAGWGAIWYGLQKVSFTAIELVLPETADVVAYVGICAAIGLLSGYLGIRRLLR